MSHMESLFIVAWCNFHKARDFNKDCKRIRVKRNPRISLQSVITLQCIQSLSIIRNKSSFAGFMVGIIHTTHARTHTYTHTHTHTHSHTRTHTHTHTRRACVGWLIRLCLRAGPKEDFLLQFFTRLTAFPVYVQLLHGLQSEARLYWRTATAAIYIYIYMCVCVWIYYIGRLPPNLSVTINEGHGRKTGGLYNF